MKTAHLRRLAVALALSASSLALAGPCPTKTGEFPGAEWPDKTAETAAKKAAAIATLEQDVFTLEEPDAARKGYRTDSLVIIKDGAIVYERYARGYDATKRHISWSVGKSFSSTLVGIAEMKGALKLSDSICVHLPEYAGKPVCDITVKDVITFGTGFNWQEEYEKSSYQQSSVISMLYGVGHQDQLAHVLGTSIGAKPGTRWMYSTGDAHLAAAIAKRAFVKHGEGPKASWSLLFDAIGMKKVTFEEDAKGTPLGGSMVYATPRDFARFGYLFLKDGCWDGRRVVPEGWVTTATTPSDVYVSGSPAVETTPAGYMWWLNQAIASKSQPAPWPGVPGDAYAALGHWGQRIVVIPSENVIIVRTGDDRDESMPLEKFVPQALEVTR